MNKIDIIFLGRKKSPPQTAKNKILQDPRKKAIKLQNKTFRIFPSLETRHFRGARCGAPGWVNRFSPPWGGVRDLKSTTLPMRVFSPRPPRVPLRIPFPISQSGIFLSMLGKNNSIKEDDLSGDYNQKGEKKIVSKAHFKAVTNSKYIPNSLFLSFPGFGPCWLFSCGVFLE